MPLPVAILAGGLATRLGSETQTTPKSLVQVAGVPFIHHQLRTLRANGIRRVVVCAGHLGEQIERELGHVHDLDIEVKLDGPELLGTAGALRAATTSLGDAFFVLYGDSYLDCDYERIQHAFERSMAPALMTVCEDGLDPNAYFAGGHVLHYNKRKTSAYMHHTDYGLGVWRRSALASSYEDDLADVYHRFAPSGSLAGYEWPERYVTMGSLIGLKATRALLSSQPELAQPQPESDAASWHQDEPRQ